MGSDTGHTLLVLRHAKAAREAGPGTADADRPLTGRGRRDAAAAGRWLAEAGLVPDVVLCSAARRTRQTWRQVLAGLGPEGARAELRVEPRLYQADATALLDAVRAGPGEAGVMLVVGHNPAAHQLVIGLTGSPETFPTCSLAVVRLRGGWAGAAPGGGGLAACWTPAVPAVLPLPDWGT